MSNKLLVVAIVCFMVGAGCTTPGIHRVAQQNPQPPHAWPKLLAVYMPWFGDRQHMDVGYVSYDPAVLRKQIQQARHMGISGFVVDWYGASAPFSDHNFALLEDWDGGLNVLELMTPGGGRRRGNEMATRQQRLEARLERARARLFEHMAGACVALNARQERLAERRLAKLYDAATEYIELVAELRDRSLSRRTHLRAAGASPSANKVRQQCS